MKTSWLAVAFVLYCTTQLLAQNAELKTLADEDQAVRLGTQKVSRTDEDRIKRVLELLAQGSVQTQEDKFRAALVLQHTPFDICEGRLVSKSSYNYLLAHDLAKESFAAGYPSAKNMIAVTLDRYLWVTTGIQRYGTQRAYNQETGKEEWVPIDRSVPDSERAKYGVPPLAELLRTYPEQAKTRINKPEAIDSWPDWSFLLGEWSLDQGGGVPGQATTGYFSLTPDLSGRILLRKNHSEYSAANGKPAVVHDDLMIVFHEASMTKALYNDSEGHVIQYNVSLSPDKKRITFLSERAAGQPQYRLTYENLGQDTVNVVFEIAPADKPDQFSKYVEGVVHRKTGSR